MCVYGGGVYEMGHKLEGYKLLWCLGVKTGCVRRCFSIKAPLLPQPFVFFTAVSAGVCHANTSTLHTKGAVLTI